MPRKRTVAEVPSPVIEDPAQGLQPAKRNGDAPLGPGARHRLKVLLDLALAIGEREGLLQSSARKGEKEIT